MHQFEFLIWSFLAVLGYVTLHAVIERLLFHAARRLARQYELDEFASALREFQSLEFAHRQFSNKSWYEVQASAFVNRNDLGWLGPLLWLAKGDRNELKRGVYDFRRIVTRFAGFLSTMVNVGGYLGLLGTVLAFVQMADQSENFARLMPFAFQTTFAGLLISIPASLTFGLLEPRVDRFLDQSDQVLDALDDVENGLRRHNSESLDSETEDTGPSNVAFSQLVESQERVFSHLSRIVQQLDEFLGAVHLNSPTESLRDVLVEAFSKLPTDDPRRANGHGTNGAKRKGNVNGSSKTT